MAKLGKRTRALREAFDGKDNLSVEDAIALIKGNATAKFDETVEISMNLGVDPRHADQMVRGVVGLPNGTGKTVRVAVFARGAKADEAQAAGADIVGAEDLMETIQGGKIEFDRCIATPDMMPIVGRLGKVLGPRKRSRMPRAVRCSSRPKRPVWCMPESARHRSTRPSWPRMCAPLSLPCSVPSRPAQRAPMSRKSRFRPPWAQA